MRSGPESVADGPQSHYFRTETGGPGTEFRPGRTPFCRPGTELKAGRGPAFVPATPRRRFEHSAT